MSEEKMVKMQVSKAGLVFGKKLREVGDIIEISEGNAAIFADRLCKPGKQPSAAGRKSDQVKELEGENAELAKRVEELESQNKALHTENAQLKAAK